MKKLLSLLIFHIFCSCGESSKSKSATSDDFEFNYELDTVKINSGDLLLAVDGGISRMALSPDKNFLYFYNVTNKRLDEIDLESYEIVRSITFTQEGPKGIGSLSPYEFHITENRDIFTSSFEAIRKMSSEGDLIERLNWDEMDFVASQIPEMTIVSFAGDFNDEGTLFFGTYGKSRGGNSSGEGLMVIDWEEEKSTVRKVPLLSSLEEYKIVLEGEIPTIHSDRFYLQEFDNQVLISTNGVNGIAIYDYKSDSLTEKNFSSDLLPERRPGNFPRRVNSMEALEDAVKSKALEHQFGPFVYDETSKRFYRVSYYRTVSPSAVEKWKYILSIFDENLVHLQDVADFPAFSGNVFFKDGMLHKGINQDDELALVRIKPTITYE